MLPVSNSRKRSRSSSLRASLRVPKRFMPFVSGEPSKLHHPLADATAATEEPLSFSDEDLVDLAPEEKAVATEETQEVLPESSLSTDPIPLPILARSRRSLSRFSTFRRHSHPPASRFASTETAEHATEHHDNSEPLADEQELVPPFSRPVSSGATIGLPSTDRGPFTPHSVSIDEPAFGLDTDPFQKDKVEITAEYPKLVPVSPLRVEEILDPNCIEPSPPATRVASTSTITPSLAISIANIGPVQRVLQRLRSITRGRALTHHNDTGPAPETYEIFSDGHGAFASSSGTHGEELLPELSFDSTPLADLIFAVHVSGNAVTYQDESGIFQPPLPVPPPAPAPAADTAATREQNLQVVKWQRVDPKDLTPSPYTSAASDISPADTPLIVPSPSWLSRNIFDLEFARNANRLYPSQYLSRPPPSPSPLPIPNRSLFPAESHTPTSFIENLEPAESPIQSQSDGSSVTLYSPSKPILRISPPTPRASASHLSVVGYRKSPSESRRSLNSFLTYASAAFSGENPLLSVKQDSPAARLFLLLHNQSRQPSPIDCAPSPLPLPINVTFDPFSSRTPITPVRSRSSDYRIYHPTPEAFEASKDLFPLPEYLRALVRSTFRNSMNYAEMSTSAYGKPADTVDWGDEVDYSNYEWFKNPPSPRPRAAPSTPPPASEPYVPQPGVVEENEAFEYALRAAPNVLYGRFKQYGQLGVLAWCSEFGEMIDALKTLGLEGNMFVGTRQQALATCEEILGLNLHEEIEMQIIVMYLSSQIARLRRFLDSDRQFEDYPQPKFPLDPHVAQLPGQMS